jgi:hypothetical protein
MYSLIWQNKLDGGINALSFLEQGYQKNFFHRQYRYWFDDGKVDFD